MSAGFGRLTSPDQLAERLTSAMGRPALLDIRWALGAPPGREEYEHGHIPGAVFVDLETELAGGSGPRGRHPLPDPVAFTASMRAAGVSGERAVVVYDAATSMAAARGWWLLGYFGHPEVSVLDGGLAAWVEAGHPISTETPATEPGDFEARPGGKPVLDAAGAAVLAHRGMLLDARAPERFRGEREPVDPVAGHIPGARNVPTSENVGPDGRFRGSVALRDAFERAGAADGVVLGAYCGSGVTAAHEVLALELAGFQAALYPGSWSEWITDPDRPVAKGD